MSKDNGHAPCCATIGFFDGVHRGHQYLISQLMADAKQHDMESLVITFRQHPRQVLQQDYIPSLLTTSERKEQLLRTTGVDHVVMLEFSLQLARLSAREFMTFLHDEYNVQRLLIGYDNRFGHNREETFEDYRHYGTELGIAVEAMTPFSNDGLTVSSSLIRSLLADGDMAKANDCLGYRYTFTGVVEHGFGEGHKLGFPTANLHVAAEQLIPKRGVYAVMASIEGIEGEFMGMINIGNRPTYDCYKDTLEVNIFGLDADIYGKKVEVTFADRIREAVKFDSIDQLRNQLTIDRNTAIEILKR